MQRKRRPKRSATGDLFQFILWGLLLLGLIVFIRNCSRIVRAEEPDEWKKWEKEAGQAGAGEPVPPPDDAMTPHETWCQGVKGWCPSVANGVYAGQHWCLPNCPKCKPPKCYHSHRNRSYDIYLKWKGWIDLFTGGKPGLHLAQTIRTESEGEVFTKTKSKTQECGIASIDRAKAKHYDINACDPKANLWAAGYMRNVRLIKLRKNYPQLVRAPLADQWKLAGGCGSVGSHRIRRLIERSGALRTQDDGSLYYARPHERILKWLVWADKSGKGDFYSLSGSFLLGRNPGRTAFRIARAAAFESMFEDLYMHGIPYGEPALPQRPDDILPFPGDSKHCQCWRWPELKDKQPKPYTDDPDLKDPREE